MTQTNDQSTHQNDVLQPLVDFWTGFFEKGQQQTAQALAGLQEACDPKAIRRRWLDALSQALDSYMRTPAFLDGMRRHFEMMTQAQSANDDLAREFSRLTGAPRSEDISGLFARLQMGQEAILARLRAIEARLDSLELSKRKRHES